MLEQLERVLLGEQLERRWADALTYCSGIPEARLGDGLTWIRRVRDEWMEVAREVEDPEELEVSLAVRYIELKSHWIMLNTQVQYQNVRRGEADPEVVCRASLTSMLLATIEPLLRQSDLQRITSFLAQPVGEFTGVMEG